MSGTFSLPKFTANKCYKSRRASALLFMYSKGCETFTGLWRIVACLNAFDTHAGGCHDARLSGSGIWGNTPPRLFVEETVLPVADKGRRRSAHNSGRPGLSADAVLASANAQSLAARLSAYAGGGRCGGSHEPTSTCSIHGQRSRHCRVPTDGRPSPPQARTAPAMTSGSGPRGPRANCAATTRHALGEGPAARRPPPIRAAGSRDTVSLPKRGRADLSRQLLHEEPAALKVIQIELHRGHSLGRLGKAVGLPGQPSRSGAGVNLAS